MGVHKKEKGMRGETVACDYLVREGYTIVDRNWRAGHCELDVVAQGCCACGGGEDATG